MSENLLRIVFVTAAIFFFSPILIFAQKPKPTPKKPESKIPAAVVSLDYSDFEKNVLDEINAVRINPSKYIPFLEERLKLLKGNSLTLSDGSSYVTFEGTTAINEAIAAVKTISKLNFLDISKGLSKAAKTQLNDLQQDSSLGHKGKNGSNVRTRIAIFGTASEGAENIVYDAHTAREAVLQWIIDDGNARRGHRKNIFATQYTNVGIACGKGKDGGNMCVAVFAKSFVEKEKSVSPFGKPIF